MAEEWKIEGKRFLITGGASGLGAAYVEEFLKHGAEKVAILDIGEEAGKKLTDKLNQTYKDSVIFIKCDVSKEDQISSAFEQVLSTFKRIDVIINNAGIMNDAPNVWRTACDTNWQGLISFTMKGISHMRKDEGGVGGTIINVSSVAAFFRVSVLPIYCGAKAAVMHFGRTIATPEFNSDSGVRILTVCFGPTATALMQNLESKTFDNTTSKQLLADSPPPQHQKIESAVAAVLKMFKVGTPGSVWLSVNDKPGLDITSKVDASFDELEKLLLPDGVSDISAISFKRKN